MALEKEAAQVKIKADDNDVTEEDIAVVRDICDGFSRTELVAENLMDVVTAVSGSSPARSIL